MLDTGLESLFLLVYLFSLHFGVTVLGVDEEPLLPSAFCDVLHLDQVFPGVVLESLMP